MTERIPGTYTMKGLIPRFRHCLRHETKQVVSDEDLALYRYVRLVAPEMLDPEYETHEEVCVEWSEEREAAQTVSVGTFLDTMERTDTPLFEVLIKRETQRKAKELQDKIIRGEPIE